MNNLQWSEEYAVGIESIDREHRVLFDLYNELRGSILRGESRSMTAAKLEMLGEFTEKHFGDEEQLMAESGYPRLEEHRALHQQLSRQVQEMQERFRDTGNILTVDALGFIYESLNEHTLRDDRAYFTWAQQLVDAEALRSQKKYVDSDVCSR